jgi:hypothetical protein
MVVAVHEIVNEVRVILITFKPGELFPDRDVRKFVWAVKGK